MRLHDTKLLARVRACRTCAWCGKRRMVHAAHLMSRGAGQVDIAGNVLPLCVDHHSHSHDGNSPTTSELFKIAGQREGVDPQVIIDTVHLIRRIPKGTVDFDPYLAEVEDEQVRKYARKCLINAGRMAA